MATEGLRPWLTEVDGRPRLAPVVRGVEGRGVGDAREVIRADVPRQAVLLVEEGDGPGKQVLVLESSNITPCRRRWSCKYGVLAAAVDVEAEWRVELEMSPPCPL